MVDDCIQAEHKGNVCDCTANQVSGLMALGRVPETVELYNKEIHPMINKLVENIGILCFRKKYPR